MSAQDGAGAGNAGVPASADPGSNGTAGCAGASLSVVPVTGTHLTRQQLRDLIDARLLEGVVGDGFMLLRLDVSDGAAVDCGQAPRAQRLARVADRLVKQVRACDLFCRLEDDAYACVLPHVRRREEASALACRLCSLVASTSYADTHLHAHAGIAICPFDGATPEVLLKHAEDALYRAKRCQLGYAFFDWRTDP